MIIISKYYSAILNVQNSVIKKYLAQISLATLICFLGTLQATVLAVALEGNISKWALGWDMNEIYRLRYMFGFLLRMEIC